ncbi:UDP-glucose dehydrogenase family protein [Desulfonatronovibrio hydrogenovorans]|uniref:UDP-glucose dehydrogenase family protein n=1 Tax=Desulfonatronovibrio hydrogenovorans TaxID=53245 RepID=UPI00068DEE0C|nr:UDP-glucose/GDP-mannose dehydrogenase family protein [Desulfonatronovibrio hydrogenovorans]
MDVCIVGTGYVGLVSAACFAEMGNRVFCVDVNPKVVESLNSGKIHIFEPGLEELVQRNHKQGRLFFTTDLKEGLSGSLFVFICVGTPPGDGGRADMSYVYQVAREVGKTMEDYKIIVDKSTVPVGTADRVRSLVQEELDRRGENFEFDVVSNPEFLKEGDAVSDFMKPDRVIVGTDNIRTAELLKALYSPFARSRDKLIVMSVRSAEMTKYAANCMLATKISFINEMANICEKVGADIGDVRAGIGSDHRIGYHFIYPGVGYGGSCFPKDVKALIGTAHDYGYKPRVLEAVDSLNQDQKRLLAEKIIDYFESQGGVSGRRLALWGLAFKANTDDIREAPSMELIRELTGKGMKIRAYDPEAGQKAAEELAGNNLVEICNDQYEALAGAHALAVATEWNQFRNPDFARIRGDLVQPVIFDGRNLYSPRLVSDLGFAYFCVGRCPVLPGQEMDAGEKLAVGSGRS